MSSEDRTQSAIPTLAYFAWDHHQDLNLCLRFTGLFGARRGTRAILERLKGHGILVKISYSQTEPNSGEFDVDLRILNCQSETELMGALTNNPPRSNRGVTTIE